MIGYIYKVTCLVNNKIYIGKHQKPEFDETYWGSGKAFSKALKKYGKENFKREIIDTAKTIEELLDKEEYWIQTLQAMDRNIGYNILKRGDLGNSNLIKIIKGQETQFICIDQFAQYEQEGWAKIDYKETDKAYYQKHREQIRKQQKYIARTIKKKLNSFNKLEKLKIKNKEKLVIKNIINSIRNK